MDKLDGKQPKVASPLDLLSRGIAAGVGRSQGLGEEHLLRFGGQGLGLAPGGKKGLVEWHGAPREHRCVGKTDGARRVG